LHEAWSCDAADVLQIAPHCRKVNSSVTPVLLKTVLRWSGPTATLHDGAAAVTGVKFDFIDVTPPIAAYRRMVRHLEFDLCELAPTTYFIARAFGAPFTALPIFLTRRFHHHGLVVRPHAGITAAKDLEGKKVGVRAYSVTTGVWTRGILTNEYGVDAARITWVVDDEEHVTRLKLPANVIQAPKGKSLAAMMNAGELAAAFTGNAGIGREGPPKSGWETQNRPAARAYRELFPDAHELEAEWYRRTGIYPFHNLVVVKDDILRSHPWIAKSLFGAFTQAKAQWLSNLKTGRADTTDDKAYRDLMPLVGDDPMPYGVRPNLKSIEALIHYSVQQALMPRRLAIEELFVDPEAS
jgi:4,5-dihydroxyphthalate decarboxylase